MTYSQSDSAPRAGAGRADGRGYKILVTDLDGTLLEPKGGVREDDRKTIEELQRRGVIVTIATGRMYSGTRHVARGLGLHGPLACVDGSHIVDAGSDRDLLCHTVPDHARGTLRGVLSELDLATVVFSRDVIFHDARSADYLPFLVTWSDRVSRLEDVLHEAWWLVSAEPAATVSLGAESAIREAERQLVGSSGGALSVAVFAASRDPSADLWGMIVRAGGANKGTALEWIARHHDCTPAETVAVGDWLNDIPMLERAGRSFCMGQAPPEVRQAAHECLESDAWSGGAIRELAERCGWL